MEISLENLYEDTGPLRVNLNTGKLNSFGRSLGYTVSETIFTIYCPINAYQQNPPP